MGYSLSYTPYNTNLFITRGGAPIPVLDPDAEAFLLATAITDATITTAINNLVVGMKADGVWSKMHAIYPFVGGTATTHKFNLKNPVDSDAAFRLVFNGGWSHNSDGVLPNGINGYANTFFIPSVQFGPTDYSSLSFYSRTDSITANIQTDMGVTQLNPSRSFILFSGYSTSISVGGFQSDFPDAYNYQYFGSQGTNTNTLGFFNGTCDELSNSFYKNGSLIAQSTFAKVSTRTSPIAPLAIGADLYNFNPRRYTNKNYAFAHIGNSLTSTDVVNFNSRVQAFQTTLGRQV